VIGRDKTQHHAAVLAALSTPRLTPFRLAADGDDELALRLYQWNVELSSACYEVLHVLEGPAGSTSGARLCRRPFLT